MDFHGDENFDSYDDVHADGHPQPHRDGGLDVDRHVLGNADGFNYGDSVAYFHRFAFGYASMDFHDDNHSDRDGYEDAHRDPHGDALVDVDLNGHDNAAVDTLRHGNPDLYDLGDEHALEDFDANTDKDAESDSHVDPYRDGYDDACGVPHRDEDFYGLDDRDPDGRKRGRRDPLPEPGLRRHDGDVVAFGGGEGRFGRGEGLHFVLPPSPKGPR
jgi:hypothetical protein